MNLATRVRYPPVTSSCPAYKTRIEEVHLRYSKPGRNLGPDAEVHIGDLARRTVQSTPGRDGLGAGTF
jgi:hypothetical protein